MHGGMADLTMVYDLVHTSRKRHMQIHAALLSVVLVATPVPAARAAAAEPGWVTSVHDGISLTTRRTPVAVTPSPGKGVATRSDFDGDGRDDVAVYSDDGFIVQYSSAPYRDDLRVVEYGSVVCSCAGAPSVAGDFDGDGYDDLVLGNYYEQDTSAGVTAGAVWVFPGGPDGLRLEAVQHFNQSTAGVPGSSEKGDGMGLALAAGDLTGDGRDDLAIGVPLEGIGSAADAGGVIVLRGSAAGLTATGAQWIDQGTSGVPGSPEKDDYFGWGLAIGKVDKNNYADLVVGTPLENEHDLSDGSGMLTQFWGGASGVSLSKVTAVNGADITHGAHTKGTYIFDIGYWIGIVDTDGDGYGEVIAGDPWGEVDNDIPGLVASFAGRSSGLSASGVKILSQDTSGVPGGNELNDFFGRGIAVGDVTGDGLGDVLVGVPGEDIGSTVDAGSVVLLRGSSTGLSGAEAQELDQSSASVPGSAESNDGFGAAVTLLNLDGSGPLEALVGTPREEVGGDDKGYPSGTVTAFPAGAKGLGLGVTTTGKSLVPADERILSYGYALVGPQGS